MLLVLRNALPVLGNTATAQGQSASSSATLTVSGSVATAQGQSASSSATLTVSGSVATAQGQSASSSATTVVLGSGSTSQGQSATGAASASVQGTVTSGQAETSGAQSTVALTGDWSSSQGSTTTSTAVLMLAAQYSSSQAQTTTAGQEFVVLGSVSTGQTQTSNSASILNTTKPVGGGGSASVSFAEESGRLAVSAEGSSDSPDSDSSITLAGNEEISATRPALRQSTDFKYEERLQSAAFISRLTAGLATIQVETALADTPMMDAALANVSTYKDDENDEVHMLMMMALEAMAW